MMEEDRVYGHNDPVGEQGDCGISHNCKHISDTAREVAKKIFAEIEDGVKSAVSALQFENNPIHREVKREIYSSFMRFVKSVEEKYTEGEG